MAQTDEKIGITPAQQEELQAHFSSAEKKVNLVLIIFGLFAVVAIVLSFLANDFTSSSLLPILLVVVLFFAVKKIFEERRKEIASGSVKKDVLKFLKNNPLS